MTSTDQVLTILHDKLSQRTRSLTQAFRKLDASSNGFVTIQDFATTLSNFGLRLTRPALAALLQRYDKNDDGVVSYAEFCAAVSGKTEHHALAAEPKMAPATPADRAEETFRRILHNATESLAVAFLKMDADRSGRCSVAEMAQVFTNHGVLLNDAELQTLVKKYDVNGDGQLDVAELAKCIYGYIRFPLARGMKRQRGV